MSMTHTYAALLHAIAEGRDLSKDGAAVSTNDVLQIIGDEGFIGPDVQIDSDTDNDLYIEGVIDDMITNGFGASDDHDSIKLFFKRVGFSDAMANRLHLMIATEFKRPAREGNPHERKAEDQVIKAINNLKELARIAEAKGLFNFVVPANQLRSVLLALEEVSTQLTNETAPQGDVAYATMDKDRPNELPAPVRSSIAAHWDTIGQVIEARNAIALEVKSAVGLSDVRAMIAFTSGVEKLADVPIKDVPWLTYRLGMLMGKKRIIDYVAGLKTTNL